MKLSIYTIAGLFVACAHSARQPSGVLSAPVTNAAPPSTSENRKAHEGIEYRNANADADKKTAPLHTPKVSRPTESASLEQGLEPGDVVWVYDSAEDRARYDGEVAGTIENDLGRAYLDRIVLNIPNEYFANLLFPGRAYFSKKECAGGDTTLDDALASGRYLGWIHRWIDGSFTGRNKKEWLFRIDRFACVGKGKFEPLHEIVLLNESGLLKRWVVEEPIDLFGRVDLNGDRVYEVVAEWHKPLNHRSHNGAFGLLSLSGAEMRTLMKGTLKVEPRCRKQDRRIPANRFGFRKSARGGLEAVEQIEVAPCRLGETRESEPTWTLEDEKVTPFEL